MSILHDHQRRHPGEVSPIEVLAFIGLCAGEAIAVGLLLILAGLVAVAASRRREDDGLDR